MQKINNYLEKFKILTIPDETIRQTAVNIIKSEIGVDLEIKDTAVKGSVLYIKCSGPAKSEIFLRKGMILKKMNNLEGNKKILDIK